MQQMEQFLFGEGAALPPNKRARVNLKLGQAHDQGLKFPVPQDQCRATAPVRPQR